MAHSTTPTAPRTAPTLLADAHLRMLRDESGITPEVIAERGYRTVDGAAGYAELKALGFSKAQALTPGLLLPLWTTDGQQALMVYRPDTPRIDKDGKVIKYELPKGAGVRLDCPPRCLAGLADPSLPLWITEGQKKADSLASHGAVALCLLGVWSFIGKNTFGSPTLLTDFDYVGWNGRDVRLVFDSDVTSKPSVRKALERLTEHLTRKHASVRMVYLPPIGGKKVGVDDFLVAGHTLQDLEALLDTPRPQPQPAPSHVEVLDVAPACIRRPLALIDGQMYAAVWLHVQVTCTQRLGKAGNIVQLSPPEVTTEQRLFIVRDDGVIFGDGGQHPLSDLGVDVHLPEIPQQSKLWTAPSVKAYVAGTRPDPRATFRQVVSVVNRFIDFNRSLGSQETMCELVACYILATWCLDAFTVIGYLWPNGERGSGKTQLLAVVAELAYLGHVILAGGSFASLRDLADYGATLCFDDAENVMDLKRGDPEKRALLLAGNRRGNSIPIKELINGREWRTRHVQTFCPRLFSAIRLPDPVLASRTIIVPLIRTADPDKANADPLDYPLWPTPRAQLVNDLWALALHHGASVPRYDAQAVTATTLLGRNLEPWRAILAVAEWLTACGVDGLAARMHALSVAYQAERPDLEPPDLTAWVIRALCHYATSGTSATTQRGAEAVEYWEFPSLEIKQSLIALLENEETGIDVTKISTDRVGRILGKLRIKKVKRVVASDPRKWMLEKEELCHWLVSYGMPLTPSLFGQQPPVSTSGTSGTSLNGAPFSSSSSSGPSGPSGTSGTSGIVAQPQSANGQQTCSRCGDTQLPHAAPQADGSTLFSCAACNLPLGVVAF